MYCHTGSKRSLALYLVWHRYYYYYYHYYHYYHYHRRFNPISVFELAIFAADAAAAVYFCH